MRTENELGSLGDGRDGVDIGITRRLNTNETEEETEDKSQNNFSTGNQQKAIE